MERRRSARSGARCEWKNCRRAGRTTSASACARRESEARKVKLVSRPVNTLNQFPPLLSAPSPLCPPRTRCKAFFCRPKGPTTYNEGPTTDSRRLSFWLPRPRRLAALALQKNWIASKNVLDLPSTFNCRLLTSLLRPPALQHFHRPHSALPL